MNGNKHKLHAVSGPGGVIGIGTGYGLDGPGIESRWVRDFPHLSRPALGLTQPPIKCAPGLPRGKERPGRGADPSHTSSAVGHERVELLSLWAVRPVQSLSACTRVHISFTLHTVNCMLI
jgi:hypothetical protein